MFVHVEAGGISCALSWLMFSPKLSFAPLMIELMDIRLPARIRHKLESETECRRVILLLVPRMLDLRPDALLPVDIARRGGAGGGADTSSAEVKAVHYSSSPFGRTKSPTCSIREGTCWSFLGPAHSLEVEVEVEVGELERKMPLRKPPKPNRLLLPPAFVGVDDDGNVLAVGVSLAEGWLFRYRFTTLGSSSLSLKATVPAVDRESPESLNDSTVRLLLQDALELSIADKHMVGLLEVW